MDGLIGHVVVHVARANAEPEIAGRTVLDLKICVHGELEPGDQFVAALQDVIERHLHVKKA